MYRGQSLRREYCSDKCRDRTSGRIRYKQETPATCKECGKEFIRKYGNERFCSDECRYKSIRQSAARSFKKLYVPKPPKFTACASCGTETNGQKYCSPHCRATEQYKRDKAREFGTWENYEQHKAETEEQKRREREERREREKKKPILKTCIVCGAEFSTLNPKQTTCSKECAKKRDYARKQNRIPKKQMIDNDITLEALYRRDSGVCYLCGGLCDWNDKDKEKNICGGSYPSIDHIIPISRGGFHAWGNVRLAHLSCNIQKSDTMPENAESLIPANAYEYKRETKRKQP